MGKKKYEVLSMTSIAQELNDITYTDYFNRLMLIAKTRFKWNGLPPGIDEKWIEKYLFSEGKCMFYKDKELGYMVTKCTTIGKNEYDEPIKLKPIMTNRTHTALENNEDCILIRNNDEMIPTSPTIQLYAYRLAEITRTIDINIHAMKTPILVKCTQNQKLSFKQAYQNWEGNEPVTFVDNIAELDKFDVLKTDAPIVFDKLQIQKHAIWNEVMTYLGVNNANMEKRERLVDDEVQANDDQIELGAQVMLKARQKACELINKMFDTNISVELREGEFMDSEGSESKGSESKGSEPIRGEGKAC